MVAASIGLSNGRGSNPTFVDEARALRKEGDPEVMRKSVAVIRDKYIIEGASLSVFSALPAQPYRSATLAAVDEAHTVSDASGKGEGAKEYLGDILM